MFTGGCGFKWIILYTHYTYFCIMAADICTICYKCSSSTDNDIAKEDNGMGPIKGHNKYPKLILPAILYNCDIWSHI